jgi:transcriptional/translational regulatory protein YebC/TACO1
VESAAEAHTVTCAVDDLNTVRDALEKRFGVAQSAKLVWRPKALTLVAGEGAQSLLKLLESLEDNDDVQSVYANFEMAEDVMAELSA